MYQKNYYKGTKKYTLKYFCKKLFCIFVSMDIQIVFKCLNTEFFN